MKRITAGLAATLLFVVTPAFAETDVESELAKMREAMEGLQDKVEAQEEQLNHQKELLEDAHTAVRAQQEQSKSLSGLSQFLDSIEVDGHVAGSYNYNFNHVSHGGDDFFDASGTDRNTGFDGVTLPFHRDDNTFTIDQVWFGIGKPATEESAAGFRFDIFYGQNANFLGQGIDEDNSRRYQNFDGTSDYYVAQAYLEYTCGCIGDGLNFKFGKFQTMVGAEVIQATGNYNITRGALYTLLQPVDHLGLLATQSLGPVQVQAGVVSSIFSSVSAPDNNDEKGYIGSVVFGDDRMSLRGSFLYGAEGYPDSTQSDNGQKSGLVDVTAFFNPTDNIGLWANYNYLYLEGTGLYAQGVAVAGRVGITDRFGVALRGEYIRENPADSIPGDEDFTGIGGDEDANEIYTATLTFDYALTDHLVLRAEGRYDFIEESGYRGFLENGSGGDGAEDQVVGLVEAIYEF